MKQRTKRGAESSARVGDWPHIWKVFDAEQRNLVLQLVRRTKEACEKDGAPFDMTATVRDAVEAVQLGHAEELKKPIPDTRVHCRLRQYESPPAGQLALSSAKRNKAKPSAKSKKAKVPAKRSIRYANK